MTIQSRGKLIDFQSPKVMGILNCTQDSFYDGGRYTSLEKLHTRIDQMIAQGVDIIDVGGQSSRPGATFLTSEEEWKNIEPALSYLAEKYPHQLFSVDSFWSETHRKAYPYGLGLINDISAGSIDSTLWPTVAELELPYVLMHMRGKPADMQAHAHYENVTIEVNTFFSEKIEKLRTLGVKDIILDPGFGFSKTREHNFELMAHLSVFGWGDFPLLVGISRKSMIYTTLDILPENALSATSALHMYALLQGAHILRVHDVEEARQCIKLYQSILF